MGAGAAALGIVMGAAGAGVQANSNSHKRSDQRALASDWQPDYQKYTDEYFNNLDRYTPRAEELSSNIGKSEMTDALALREQALPGIGKATQSAAEALFPLLKGELPPEVLRAFNSSGAASSVGGGFGGSGFGFVNQGLFGARGALGAMQTGYSMLGSLLSTMPRVNSPSVASFLNQLITPQQRVGDQLAFRSQQIGIMEKAIGMPSGGDAWANYLTSTGGALTGAGTSMMSQKQPSSMTGDGGASGPEGAGAGGYDFGSMGTTQPSGGMWGTGE